MQWFNELKVGTKIIFGFCIMLVFLAVIGLVGFRSLKDTKLHLNKIFSVNMPSIDYLLQADRDMQQLLVAERSMIFASSSSETFQELVKEFETNLKQASDRWEKYKKIAASPEERVLIAKYEKDRKEWQAISRKIVDGRIADTRAGRRVALDLSLGIAKEKFEAMRDNLDQLTEINHKLAKEAHHAAEKTYHGAARFLLISIGAGLLAGLLLMWGLGRSVTRPLKAVIQGLSLAAQQVSAGSGQVSSSSQNLAEGASEQAASIEETSASIEELSSMTRANADNAGEAKSMMGTASQIVAKVNQHMDEMTGAISEITQKSEETSKIIKTIDEIAFQTNLLALNAAVEAARAGEAGAGFAVVADEVRNLAMRAAEAASNTSTLIEDTIKAVHSGSELTTSTQAAFQENVEIAGKVAELIEEIANASAEQAHGIEQLNIAMSEMDTVVQRVAANAEESASTSEEMNAQAKHMNEMVTNLTTMVGRDKKPESKVHRTNPVNTSKRQRHTSVKSSLLPPVSKPNHKKEGQQKPEDIIPMDEEDFQDF